MMKSFALAALGCALLAPYAIAQAAPSPSPAAAPAAIPPEQQATKAQIDKLFEVMHLREQMNAILATIPKMIQQQLDKEPSSLPDGEQLTPDQMKAVRNLLDSYVRKSVNLYSADEMMADMTDIYRRHFTRDDLDAYIAFYNSPPGRHLLEAQPLIMKEYMPVVMQRVQKRGQALAEQERKEMEDLLKSFDRPGSSTQPK